jgi:hypothetical protein
MAILDRSQEKPKETLPFKQKCDLSASAMRNTGKPWKAEVTHSANRQNCSGDTHEEAFNPTCRFRIYRHRKSYGYCRYYNLRFADKGDFIWQKLQGVRTVSVGRAFL